MTLILFVSALCLFLYGMQKMEYTLGVLGNRSLKHGIQHYTRTPFHGIILGVLCTAILQSSSLVGLITLAFVGAGIIRLFNAIGIILGSNLGTTFTGWIVTFIGFKLNLSEFYLPILGIGAAGMIFTPFTKRMKLWFEFVFSVGLLLMGLLLMKDSIEFITEFVNVKQIASYSPLVFFLIGVGLTAITQSSSATMMITLSAMHADLIQLPNAAALIIGADLGTTSTVIIGSLQGSPIKRQVSLIHFIFNLITDLLAFFSLPLLLYLVTTVYAIQDPLIALVALHSSFNLVGILVFLPFIRHLERFTARAIKVQEQYQLHISQVNYEVADVALKAASKDLKFLMTASVALNAQRFSLTIDHQLLRRFPLQLLNKEESYNQLKKYENLLTDYLLDLQGASQDKALCDRAQQLLVCIRDILFSVKSVKDIQNDINEIITEGDIPTLAPLKQSLAGVKMIYLSTLDTLEGRTEFSPVMLKDLLRQVRQIHREYDSQIYQLIDDKSLKHEEASTAFNINREMLLSLHSLLNALDHFFIPKETAQTLSEILNIER